MRALDAAPSLVLLGLCLAVAGCSDNPLPPDATAEMAAVPELPTKDGANASLLSYPGPVHFMQERWENGTFTVTQHNFPIGGLVAVATGQPDFLRVFDLSEDLPHGMPVFVHATVDASTKEGQWPQGGDVNLGLRAVEADFISAEFQNPYGGHGQISAWLQLISGEPVGIVLGYGQMDPSPEVTYTVHIEMMGAAALIPAQAVAALDLAPGDKLVVEAMDDQANVVLYDAADAFVGRVDAAPRNELLVPDTATAGTFILVNGGVDGGPVNVYALRNDTTPLRPVVVEWTPGTEHAYDGNPIEWSDDVQGNVLSVGLLLRSTEDRPFRCQSVDLGTSDPKGHELFRIQYADATCIGSAPLFGIGLWNQTGLADERVTPGAYKTSVERSDALDLVAQMWFLHYKR